MATLNGPTIPAAGGSGKRPDLPSALAAALLSPPARALIAPNLTGPAYVAALAAAELWADAVRATAFLLAPREAVWWAARCARAVPAAVADPKAAAALAAADAWAAEPTDANRRAAFTAAEAVGLGTPAGAVGAAAFFSDGSIAPPRQPSVPAPAHLAPTTAGSAVLLAAVITEPERAPERLRQFVMLGEQVAGGSDRWPEPRPGAAPRPGATPPNRRT